MEDRDDPSVGEQRAALRETQRVLRSMDAAWKPFSCARSGECCQLTKTGLQPHVWPTEWALILEHLKRAKRALPAPRPDGACSFLDPSGLRCSIYEARPIGCRTYFCERIVGPAQHPTAATHDAMNEIASINIGLDSAAAPKPLLEWLAPK